MPIKTFKAIGKVIIVFFLVNLLSSCGRKIEFDITDLSLLEDKTMLSGDSSIVSVRGFIKVTIETNLDLIPYAKEHALNLWYEVKGCKSGNE